MINTCIKNTSQKATYFIRQKNYQSYKMGVVKQIDIKNRIYYFYKDIINMKDFNLILLKPTENHSKYWYLQHWIYYN